jgi:hypothetical protein
MKTSENINEIAKALSVAQAEIKPASKDGANPHFKSKFSTLAAIWDCIRMPTTSQGLTILQDMNTEDKSSVSITTRVIHTSGQWIEFGPLSIPITKQDAQGVGSASSYGKRYALCAALGIVSSDDDDDAEVAVGRGTSKQKEPVLTYAECVTPKNMSIHQVLVLKEMYMKVSDDLKNKLDSWMIGIYKTKDIESLNESAYEDVKIKFNNCLKYFEDLKSKE